MKRPEKQILIGLIGLAALIFQVAVSSPVLAGSAGDLVKKGNQSFRNGEYRKAIEFYDKASVEQPESPVIFFNRGDALYREGEFSKAADEFMKTANGTKELPLEARAWYNMGNCSMMLGRRQSDSDMKKALDHYRSSVSRYQTSLKKDSTLHDAAVNMEIARVLIKDLLDKMKKQEEMKRKQQEKIREIVDSLVSIANRQDQALKQSGIAAEKKRKNETGWKRKAGEAGEKQKYIEEKTEDVKKKMKDIPGSEKAQSVRQAISQVDSSLTSQRKAAENLSRLTPEQAGGHQKESLEHIGKAIAALTQGNNQGDQKQEQKDGQNKEQQQRTGREKQQQSPGEDRKKRNETARQILAEEKADREKRRKMRKRSSGYTPVEKDW